MLDKLEEVALRHEDINERLSQPGLTPQLLQELNRERVHLEPIVDAFHRLQAVKEELNDNKELLNDDDADMREMAKAEIQELDKEQAELEERLKLLLLPRDPNDDKNIILEIRAGTGGDEASIFAGELFQMYSRFAQQKGLKVEMVTSSEGSMGGFKEITCSISGDQVFSNFKYESGTHRVQRVPATESQGRIHTSACTVAVLPEAEEIDLKIPDKELRIDVMRAGGPGGQSVNTTDSAVRITHLPTGMIVICQDEKSQHKNKAKAMSVMRARLLDKLEQEAHDERAADRKAMVGSGDRSEKIRTYNFPQDRCTDHRVGLTVHNLPKLFSGDIGSVIESVRTHFQTEMLKKQAE
ncbi:MAG: peptide chain release factor 1 [Deltaproteobacteria bacterium]|nr:peptide chain release factor 1 [Deltaproteobacteria bacterium]